MFVGIVIFCDIVS